MNERIIELYKEACEFAYKVCKDDGRTSGPSDHIWNTLSAGKFAELIVKECASVCESATQEGQPLHLVSIGYADRIKQHFGVEE